MTRNFCNPMVANIFDKTTIIRIYVFFTKEDMKMKKNRQANAILIIVSIFLMMTMTAGMSLAENRKIKIKSESKELFVFKTDGTKTQATSARQVDRRNLRNLPIRATTELARDENVYKARLKAADGFSSACRLRGP